MYDTTLRSDPDPMPLASAILTLLHRRKKQAFVAFTTNARGRAAVIASAIRHRDKMERGHLRDLPEGKVEDFALLATHIGIEASKADAAVSRLRRKLEKDGYKFFGSVRSAQPRVWLNGRRMSIAEAMEATKCKAPYQTVYRRFARGWSTKDALEMGG